jgi:hypothetical protein
MLSTSMSSQSQRDLEAELKAKSVQLQRSINQFTEATCEIGELEQQLAYLRIGAEDLSSSFGASSRGRDTVRTPGRQGQSQSQGQGQSQGQTGSRSRSPYSYYNSTGASGRGHSQAYRSPSRASAETHSQYHADTHMDRALGVDMEWVVEESELCQMRDEVGLAVKEESRLSTAHLVARDDLQESWDKLVKLRTHISFFYAAIEEAKIEEIASEAQGWSVASGGGGGSSTTPAAAAVAKDMYPLEVETSCLDSAVPPATADDFSLISQTPMRDSVQNVDRFVGIYVLREKVQRRDYMRQAVASAEVNLGLAREKVSNYSDELLCITAASGYSGGGSFSSARGMNLRQKVLEANLELEQAELTYLKNKDSLSEFESDLGTALLGVSEAVVTELKGMGASASASSVQGAGAGAGADLNLSHFLGQADAMDDAMSAASSIGGSSGGGGGGGGTSALVNEAGQVVHKPEAHAVATFSLQEVLSGQTRISRMNGEAAAAYGGRLKRRVRAVEPLVVQLKLEVEKKAERAREARAALKDAEVKRLRAELQLSNCEGIVREKKEASVLLARQSAQASALALAAYPHDSPLNLSGPRTPARHLSHLHSTSVHDRNRTEDNVYARYV